MRKAWAELLRRPNWIAGLLLLFLTLLAYGMLTPYLGYHWDGWGFVWIPRTYGTAGLMRYFSTNRPVWGTLYQLTTAIFGENPLAWQWFGLLSRYLSACAVYWLVNLIWPKRRQLALSVALLSLVYPGFTQQAIANLYGHFFIVFALSVFSLAAMVKAFDDPDRSRWWQLASWLSAAYALFSTEYFFGLELLRPLVAGLSLAHRGHLPANRNQSLKALARIELPYAGMIVGYLLWRVFDLNFQTYQPATLNALSQQPLQALVDLIGRITRDIFASGIEAWVLPLRDLASFRFSGLTTLLIALATIAAIGITFAGFSWHRKLNPDQDGGSLQALWVGAAALLLGGIPLWVPGLPLGLTFPYDRLTLPMLFGACLFIVGLLSYVRPPVLRFLLLGLLVGLSLGRQIKWQNEYRLAWDYQQSFYQQLLWRAPSIEPGTALVSLEIQSLWSMSDNSLTPPVNWIYAPDNHNPAMSFAFLYLPQRLGTGIPALAPGHPIVQDYLAAGFEGSTDQLLALAFEPPGCLRVLDATYDHDYPAIPDELERAIALSHPEQLIEDNPVTELPAAVFKAQAPGETWCYYFQKADLARQAGNWNAVRALGDLAYPLEDDPNDPTEHFPFIEAYARTGSWQTALELSAEVFRINELTAPMLCALWGRVGADLEIPAEWSAEVSRLTSAWNCPPDGDS